MTIKVKVNRDEYYPYFTPSVDDEYYDGIVFITAEEYRGWRLALETFKHWNEVIRLRYKPGTHDERGE